MPCDTLTVVSLELKNANLTWLKQALEACGYQVTQSGEILSWRGGNYNRQTGLLTTRTENDAARIKREYSSIMVKNMGSRFGWRVKQTGETRFQIQKG